MDQRDVQLSLVQDLLAAPGSEQGWALFLQHLAAALGGSAASFISHDFASAQTGIAVTARTDPEALAGYNQHWHQFDPWAHSPAFAQARSGSVVSGEMLIRSEDLRRSEFHNDFGRHYGIVQCLAGIIEVSPRALSCVSINGNAQRHNFNEADAALVAGLMTPLQRALEIHRRLSGAELMALNATAVLDRLPHGVLLVSKTGAVLSTNRAADQILRARDGLTSDHGELRAATVQLTNRLREAVFAASRTGVGTAIEGDVSLILPRPSGRRPLSIIIAPLPLRRIEFAADSAAAIIFVTDPDRALAADIMAFRSMFGLTPAESELVRCLASGLTLEESAAELGLRIDTVRSRLKVVFQKTNTHRQADLVRLVLTAATPAFRT